MNKFLAIAVFVMVFNPCCSRAVREEDSVVSVYTPTNADAQTNVYGQIANNIAEKITSPIYRLFGIDSTGQTTRRPFEHIELQEEPSTNKTPQRDVKELSTEALKKTEKKPEKITLFNSYLPIPTEGGKKQYNASNIEAFNDTRNEVDSDFDDDFDIDDVEETPRGPFVYLLEIVGSIIQLLWGGFLAIFQPSSS